METIKFNDNDNSLILPKDIIKNLNDYLEFCNQKPNPNNLKTNKYADNSVYLPISFLEMRLDELTGGLWETTNFITQVIANEITGSIELKFWHPVAKRFLRRVGAAAKMIGTKKGTDFTDIKNKIQNTLGKDFPALKAECFRNACLSIGKSFGRDLNREFTANFAEIYGTQYINANQIKELKMIIKTSNIKETEIFDILNNYDIKELKKIPSDMYNIIKGEINEFNVNRKITQNEAIELLELATKNNIDIQELKTIIKEFGYNNAKDIEIKNYDKIVTYINGEVKDGLF